MSEEHKQNQKVEVAVVTTSGRYPKDGRMSVPSGQPVKVELKKAVDELHIVDTTNWVARVNGEQIDPNKSYAENHLSGELTIDYGPHHGGGGCE